MIQLKVPDSVTILGLMSGTSCDGLDMALVRFGPQAQSWELLAYGESSYGPDHRQRLLDAQHLGLGEISALNAAVADRTAGQVMAFLEDKPSPDLVVSHGQTVWHQPARFGAAGGHTLQIGDGDRLSALLGLPVLWNLRAADMALGGQGAPLVPVPDRFLFGDRSPLWLLNVGGIANLTGLGPGEQLVGCDVGPGNCLLDAWIRHRSGGELTMDRDGVVSAAGRVQPELVASLMDSCRPQNGRSLARETFDLKLLSKHLPSDLSMEDGAAVLVELTASLAAEAIHGKRIGARELLLAGGGAFNPSLKTALARLLPGLEVATTARVGLAPEAREALCFAVLGWLFLQGRAGNHPAQTGASAPCRLGSLSLPL